MSGTFVGGGFPIVGCWVVVLLAWFRVVVFRVLGNSVNGHARTVANQIVGVLGIVATGVGVFVILMQLGLGKCILVGRAREEVWRVFSVKGLEVG